MSEWREVKIGDIAEKIAMGPFGSNIKVETFVDSGVPVISGSHLRESRLRDGEYNFVTEDHAERMRNSIVFRGDVIFTHAGNISNLSYIPESSLYDRYVISQRQFYLRCNLTRADPCFITYFFHSPSGRHKLLANSSQVGVPSIAQPSSYLKSISILLPPLHEQKAIAHILSTLDDKIDQLRKTNSVLEDMASALFKSWFVDFDPVKAKQENRPTGLPKDVDDLFPDSFEDSALGPIPKGWRVASLADFATFQSGYSFKGKDWTSNGHPVVKIGNVKPGMISFDGCSFVSERTVVGLSRFKLHRGDLLVGMTGYVGETGLMPEMNPCAYLNQRVGRISTNMGLKDLGFVYALTRDISFKQFAENQSHGSAQANVSGSELLKLPTVHPNTALISTYNNLIYPVIDAVISNYEMSRSLTNLRDTLLPKLISGELRVPEAEQMVAELGL